MQMLQPELIQGLFRFHPTKGICCLVQYNAVVGLEFDSQRRGIAMAVELTANDCKSMYSKQ
jgi:hypothetical protein